MEEGKEGIEPPRRFSAALKNLILQEHLAHGTNLSQLARKYQVHPVTLYQWKRRVTMEERDQKEKVDYRELFEELEKTRKENQRLKKTLAELAVDKSILQDAVEILKKKHQQQKLKSRRKSSK